MENPVTEQDPTTGTEADGDAQATGTTSDGNAEVEALRAQLADAERFKQQALAEKSNHERLKQEYDDLRRAQPPAPVPQNNVLQEAIVNASALAQQGDPQAVLTLQALQNSYESLNEQRYTRELVTKVPEIDRSEVDRIARENRVTPEMAYLILKGKRSETMEARVREAEQEVKASKPKPVQTTAVGISAQEVREATMTGTRFAADIKKMMSEGDLAGAKALRDRRDSGALKINYGT